MYCKKCGNYIEEGQVFCSSCGCGQKTTSNIIKWIGFGIIVIVMLCLISSRLFYIYMQRKYSDEDSFKEMLVETSGLVLDNNRDLHDININSEKQVDVKTIYYQKLNEFSLLVDLDMGNGYLRDVQVTVYVPVFGNSHSDVKWDYCYSEHDYYSSLPQKGNTKKNYTKLEYK